jgi:cation diffusion facilitator CzcD-associated flavoprotein CzcO
MIDAQSPGRVCVIGAGISGLVSAKTLAGDGFDVTIFEKESALGGVWAPSRTYPGLRTNATRETYPFSDHPYPDTADKFPSAPQVRDYLRSYAERFQIVSKIELNSEVTEVARNAARDSWQVTTRKLGETRTHQFDFVVVCNGVFSKPNFPEIEDISRFAGAVVHSSQSIKPEDMKGKRIVVVGAGKSAADCAVFAAHEAQSSTLLFRRPHWLLPRYAFGFINMEFIATSRFIEAFMPYYKLTPLEDFLHRKSPLLARILDRIVLSLFRLNMRMPKELYPGIMPLAHAFETSGFVTDFYRLARKGTIKAKRAEIQRAVDGRTLMLTNGETLEADLLICATGWKQETPFLEASVREQVCSAEGFHLYRTILPPALPTMGFIGYNSSNCCPISSEIAANWLSDVFLGRTHLPSIAEMENDIADMRRWIERELPDHRGGYFIGPFVSHHIDDLMRDMGLPTRRVRNVLAEHFLPRWPTRYATVAQERRDCRLKPLSHAGDTHAVAATSV